MLKDANLAASGIQLFQRSHLTPGASSAGDIYDPDLYNPSLTERCRGLALDEGKKKKKTERPFVKTERRSCAKGSEANVPLSSAEIKRRRGRSFDLMPRCDWLSWRLGGEELHTDVPDSLLRVIVFHSHAVPSANLFLLFPPVISF